MLKQQANINISTRKMFFNRFWTPSGHASFLSFILALTLIVFQTDSLFLGLSEYVRIMCLYEIIYGSARLIQCLSATSPLASTENTSVILQSIS